MNTPLSLFQLLQQVRHSVENIFPVPVWFVAEIVSLNVHQGSGHCYLELMDKDPGVQQEARTKATIWKSNYLAVKRDFEKITGGSIKPGMRLLMLGTIRFHEYYGFSVNIEEVDSAYTLGLLLQKRAQVLEKLQKLGVLHANKQLPLSIVPNRVAVISSGQAAGYGDFLHALQNNPFGYSFHTCLFEATMQGNQTVPSILLALEKVNQQVQHFDAVAILRGGGSPTDLMWFDDFELGSAIADFELPVLSGLGHKKDETVVDAVAFMSFITPTAIANWLAEKVAAFEQTVSSEAATIASIANECLANQFQTLSQTKNDMVWLVNMILGSCSERLNHLNSQLQAQTQFICRQQQASLNHWEEWIRWAQPDLQFKRGYFFVSNQNGQPLLSKPEPGQMLKLENHVMKLETQVIATYEKK